MFKRVIKLTERQIREAEGSGFKFLQNGDFRQYNGQSEVSAVGKENDEEDGEPKTTDDFAHKQTPQYYSRLSMRPLRQRTIQETDTNSDGVDDFYNNDELDTLGNENSNDDLTKIPKGVQNKADLLIRSMSNLTPKQQAIVLNKILEALDLNSLPYSWLKELRLKINNKSNTNGF